MNDIFRIDGFNIISDEENYYFFRALNNGDNRDIRDGITTEDGRIVSVRTDRDRYIEDPQNGEPKYTKEDQISLLQVYDHIKMHNRKDTNCISLSSNANVSAVYGRGSYSDRYIMVRVPKEEMGSHVFNAGEYMLEEVKKVVEKTVSELSSDDPVLERIQRIDNASSRQELVRALERGWQAKTSMTSTRAHKTRGIVYKNGSMRMGTFQILNEEQSIEKDKIMQKLALLERKGKMSTVIPNTTSNDKNENASSRMLSSTIGSAFASCEVIHYGEIKRENIIEVPKEIIDAFALIQQMSEHEEVSAELVEELKQEVLTYIKSGKNIELSNIENVKDEAKPKEDISVDEMFELTGGSVSYGAAENAIKKVFYLAKSRLRANAVAEVIERITENNPKYSEVIAEIRRSGIGIEPEIITRLSKKGKRISESVSLDIYSSENTVVEEISNCSHDELIEIVRNGGATNVRNIMQKSFSDSEFAEDIQVYDETTSDESETESVAQDKTQETKNEVESTAQDKTQETKNEIESTAQGGEQEIESIVRVEKEQQTKENMPSETPRVATPNAVMTKEEYYARAIIEMYDFKKIGISSFKFHEKVNFIERLMQVDCERIYKDVQRLNIPKSEVAKVALNIALRKETYEDITTFYEERREELTKDLSVFGIETFLGYYSVEDTKLELRDYQERTVQRVNEIYEEKKFAAVILPTGAGKSFVSITEMLQHKEETILYIAPSNEILDQVKQDIVTYCHGMKETTGKSVDEIIKEVFPKPVIFSTYAALDKSRLGKEIMQKRYGLIVLDELHRTGAEEWSKPLKTLLKRQPESTKILGVTATPRRDADGKNMADEMALELGYTKDEVEEDKHIAENIDLFTAIQLGMVGNPRILSCEYNLEKDGIMEEILASINAMSDETARREKLAEFEKLRRQIKNADGMDKILRDHLKVGGKYIVFLPIKADIENEEDEQIDDIEDEEQIEKVENAKQQEAKIKEYEKQIKEYLKGSGLTPKFYSMLSAYGRQKNKRQLDAFSAGKETDVSFLLVLNMANEGLHVKGVTGMLWFRPLDENSYILYMQQLGRVIKAEDPLNPTKDDERPIVFDFANNTFRVNIDKKINEKNEVSDLKLLSVVVEWIKIHNEIIPNINSPIKQEARYGATLNRIQEKYIKFLQDIEEYNKLDDAGKEKVDKIIKKGMEINLWNLELPEKTKEEVEKILEVKEFSVTGIIRDFIELRDSIGGENIYLRTARILKGILDEYGIDLKKVKQSKTINGKLCNIKISEIEVEEKEATGKKVKTVGEIIEEKGITGINGNATISDFFNKLKYSYNGKGKCKPMSEEEKEEAVRLFGVEFFEEKFKSDENIYLRTARILKGILDEYGIDLKKVKQSKTINGKLCNIKISEIEVEEKEATGKKVKTVGEIIEEKGITGINGNVVISGFFSGLKYSYNGKATVKPMNEEEKEEAVRLLGADFFEEKSDKNIYLSTARILKDILDEYGIDLKKVKQSKRINGKLCNMKVSEIEVEVGEGTEKKVKTVGEIIEEKGITGINGNAAIKELFKLLKYSYNGKATVKPMNEEEKEEAVRLLGADFFEEKSDKNIYLSTARILKDILDEYGIDLKKVQRAKTINGKKRWIKISEIEVEVGEGIGKRVKTVGEIIEEKGITGINGNAFVKDFFSPLKYSYNGKGGRKPMSEEEKEEAVRLLGADFFREKLKGEDIGKATYDASVSICDTAQSVLSEATKQLEQTTDQTKQEVETD